MTQSRDLREIASFRDPRYRAKADVFELNADLDLGPSLTLSSQTAYNKDGVYSFQDFNRFNTVQVFNDTSLIVEDHGVGPVGFRGVTPGGVFRSEEHTSELQSLMRISYAVFCLKKKKNVNTT